MPAHVLHGDSYLVKRQLSRLEAEAGAEDVLDANRHRLMGPQTNLNELVAICNALPFMDSHRLVVVEGLLATNGDGLLFRSSRACRRTPQRRLVAGRLLWNNRAGSGPDVIPERSQRED